MVFPGGNCMKSASIATLRTAVIGLALLCLAACAGGQGGGARPANPDEIVIGVAGPMSADLAAFGEQLRKGAEAAVADVNAKGGVLGKKLRLVVGDDQCDPRKAVKVASDLVQQGAVFVDGHFCSGSSIPASSVYAEEGILQITPSSTNPALTEGAASKGITTVLRTSGRDDLQGVFAGNWLAKTYAGRNLAILDDRSAYGAGVAQVTAKTVQSAGLTPALRDTYQQGTKDFSDLIGKLKSANIDAVYIGGYHNDFALIVRQARAQGLKADFVGADALNTAEFWSISGPAGEGVRFSDAASPINLPSAREVVAKFRSDGYEPEGYTLSAYAAVQVFAAAAAGTGSTDGRKMASWLRANHVSTVVGDLSWDSKGDLTKMNYAWFIWQNGRYSMEP